MLGRGNVRVILRTVKAAPRTMSAQNSTRSSQRIFAPGDSSNPSQAKQFDKGTLQPESLDSDPLSQFHTWTKEASAVGVPVPEACTLATAELPSGRVSSRIVYLKELDDRGFVIYSNWATSRKAADVASNPYASLSFWWRELERQVRIEGPVERLSSEESQVYYDTRIRGSRIGAWASEQSKVLRGREELEENVKQVERRFEGQDKIPVPDFWGGLRIIPDSVEFWQGRESRLHDRLKYSKSNEGSGSWKIERLSP